MARIKTRNGRHTCDVRYKGITISQTFGTKPAAVKWGRDVEVAVDERRWPVRELVPPHLWDKWGLTDIAATVDDSKPHLGWTIDRALSHYLETVTPGRKGARQQANAISWWQRQPLAKTLLPDLTPDDLQAHITRRQADGRASSTIRNEIFLLSSLYETARERTSLGGWGLETLENPVRHVLLPKPPAPRKRRLEDAEEEGGQGEEERMLDALLDGPDGAQMALVLVLALDTGMRLSELLDISVGQIKRTRGGHYVERPDSKNGHPRKVVLSSRARATLDSLLQIIPKASNPDQRLISLDTMQVDYRWRKARKAAKVSGLHFHDLRHEGLSRMAEKGLTIGELAEQSGHRTAQVLLRYVNAKVSEVARKLG